MKKYNALLAVIVLALASLACQTLLGGGVEEKQTEIPELNNGGNSDPSTPTVAPVSPEQNNIPPVVNTTDFPVPADAANIIGLGNDVVNFQTKLNLKEAMDFYRDAFGKKGYTERDGLTVTSDTTFSMVFDGHESGKAITVQGVDLGDGTTNISITLVDI